MITIRRWIPVKEFIRAMRCLAMCKYVHMRAMDN